MLKKHGKKPSKFESFQHLTRNGGPLSAGRMFLTKWTGHKRNRKTGQRAK